MNFSIGQQLLKQKEFGRALNVFSYLENNNLKDKKIFFYLGMIHFELNNFRKSIVYYNKFLKEEPNSIGALLNLAIVKQSVGKLDDAKKIYLKLIKLDKNKIRPYYGLFVLNPNYISIQNFNDIIKIRKNPNVNIYEKGIANFLLSKKEKKNNNYKKEAQYLREFHSDIFNANYAYNMSSQFYYNQIISKYFDKIKIIEDDKKNFQNSNLSPIFIIGLPRSGSTLVESILTSGNERIKTFGESNVVNMSILEQIGPEIYDKNFNSNNYDFKINVNRFQDSIINRYKQFNSEQNTIDKFFIDKSLENFLNIEIILKIFPKAKFLHTFKNLKDSIISIYQSMLPELSWTHSIENILMYIDNYLKIVEYFKLKNPKIIMDVNLENFTNNSEEISKEIFKFCNLTWSKDVCKFYEREDLFSKTLSFAQIRNQVTKYDEKKYKSYFYLLKDHKKKYIWLDKK